jgi:hypothetical protein
MRFDAPPISDLRLSRFHRWAMLWLTWLAGFLDEAAAFAPLSAQAKAIAHRWLDQIEWLVGGIVIIRAARQLRRAPPSHRLRAHKLKTKALRRAIFGARLLRRLRAKDLRARIAALRADVGALVAHILKRLPRGLTRRRPIRARREHRASPALTPPPAPALGADTS